MSKISWFIIGTGLLWRMWWVMTLPFWGDEYLYFSIAKLSLMRIITVEHWLLDHPQLYMLLQKGVMAVSTLEWWVRLPSVAYYLIGAWYLEKILGMLMGKQRTAILMTMGLFAWHPFMVSLTAQALPYGLAIMLMVANLYYFLSALKTSQRSEWVKWSVSMVLFFYTSFESVFYFGSLAVVMMWWRAWRIVDWKQLKAWGIAALAAMGLFLPEIYLVLTRENEMVRLAGDFVKGNYNHLTYLKYALLGLGPEGSFWEELMAGEMIVVVAGLILGSVYIGKKWLERKIKREELKVISLLIGLGGGFVLAIELVGKLWYEVGKDKTYYYVVLLCLIALGWLGSKIVIKRDRILVVSVLIGLVLLRWWPLGWENWKGWVVGNFLRNDIIYDPREIRAEINSFTEKEGGEWSVYASYGLDFRNISLVEYYLRCLDQRPRECGNYTVLDVWEEVIRQKPSQLVLVRQGRNKEVQSYCEQESVRCFYAY